MKAHDPACPSYNLDGYLLLTLHLSFLSPLLSFPLFVQPLSFIFFEKTQPRTYLLFENFMKQSPKSGTYCLKTIELHSWKEALDFIRKDFIHIHANIYTYMYIFLKLKRVRIYVHPF